MKRLLIVTLALLGCGKTEVQVKPQEEQQQKIVQAVPQKEVIATKEASPEIIDANALFEEWLKSKEPDWNKKHAGKIYRMRLSFFADIGEQMMFTVRKLNQSSVVDSGDLWSSIQSAAAERVVQPFKAKDLEVPELRHGSMVWVEIKVEKIDNGTHLRGICLKIEKR